MSARAAGKEDDGQTRPQRGAAQSTKRPAGRAAPSAASNGHVHPISAPHIASHGEGMLKREAARIVSCLRCLPSAGCWSSWPVQGQVSGGASGWKRDQRYRQPLAGNMFWLLLSISTLDAAADRVAAFPPDKLLRVVSGKLHRCRCTHTSTPWSSRCQLPFTEQASTYFCSGVCAKASAPVNQRCRASGVASTPISGKQRAQRVADCNNHSGGEISHETTSVRVSRCGVRRCRLTTTRRN
ncbi:hypothetical protein IWZ03DRAFT_10934 [Phyllosticta citriasiana]|uniref:Uncharacterized protein n=1 Tax=Phyllosticta citriasiana TaxID=595635 RepID=A0ABR1KY58_9PEZI